MKKYFFYLFLSISIFSCQKKEQSNKNAFNKIINSYINEYPINIKNYNYVVRFYLKNSDTLVEISQDKKYNKYPSDFNLYTISEQKKSPFRLNNSIKYKGTITLENKLIYIYDTDKNLGSSFYDKRVIKSDINLPKTFNQIDYPFLPKKRIYKHQNNNLIFIKETDTLKFK